MDKVKTKFKLGDVVTFRNHPLLYDTLIKGDSKYVPPLMIVKEIIFESNQKKTHDDITGKKIAERTKYICIYFDDDKSEFIESHLYEIMLDQIDTLHVATIDKEDIEIPTDLVKEVKSYNIPKYEYGKIVFFKTKKLEIFKRRSSKTISTTTDKATPKNKKKVIDRELKQYVVNYASPDFIISGYKKESYNDLYFKDGKLKRVVSSDLVKIQWFNPIDKKFSEQYLPIECFTDEAPFKTKLSQKHDHLTIPEPAAHFEDLPVEKTSEEFPPTI